MTIAQALRLAKPSGTLVCFALLAPLTAQAEAPPGSRSDGVPLAGVIWSPAERRSLTPGELLDRLSGARVVILGETHDNPLHHQIQAWAVRQMVSAGRRPDLVLEMVDSDQQAVLDQAKADLRTLGEALSWEKRGWPDWSWYLPIVQAALAGGGDIVAGNLPQAQARALARGEAGGDRTAELGLDTPVATEMQAEMEAEIARSHCGLLPARALAPMVLAQRARDAAMARASLASVRDERRMAVVVAGAFHGRRDRGIPERLAVLSPGLRVFSIGLVEAGPDEADPDQASRMNGRTAPFDAVWFTTPAEREDPCAGMERHMKKMGGG